MIEVVEGENNRNVMAVGEGESNRNVMAMEVVDKAIEV